MDTDKMTHMMSIEMISKKYVKEISLSNESRNRVYFKGFLGDIVELSFINGGMLEIKGVNGTFRIDLSTEELNTMITKDFD
jgi:hypothetical protein